MIAYAEINIFVFIACPTLPASSCEQGVKHDEESTTTSPYCVMVLASVGLRKREL